MASPKPPKPPPARRVSVSLPHETFLQLERLVEERGFGSRSQAVADLIGAGAAERGGYAGDEVLAGTITLFYDDSRTNLLRELADIQRGFLAEVISSHHVLLEDGFTMEVVLVQGPACQLGKLADRFRACRGLRAGRLNLCESVLSQQAGASGGTPEPRGRRAEAAPR
jgi:CopG family nickel-responsive transcriptional regulator